MNIKNILIILTLGVFSQYLNAQDVKELSLEFSNENNPKTLEVNIFNGKITILGTDRKDVFFKYYTDDSNDENHTKKEPPAKAKGMKKIAGQNTGFKIEEANNIMSIKSENFHSPMNLTIEVPKNINLDIRKQVGEDVLLENINGTINVECNIGSIIAKKISGAISASSSTGNIMVDFNTINSASTMQFTSITGDIDLTLPNSLKAHLKMRTEWGEVYSDHDIVVLPADVKPIKSEGRNTKIISNEWTIANMNGGSDLRLICNTKMGSIYLRKN